MLGSIVLGLLIVIAALIVALLLWSRALTRRAERLVPADGTFLDVPGARLHYVDRGEGPAIVMVHGLGGQIRNFSYALSDDLARDFRVIIVDRPGWGYSHVTEPGQPSLPEQAEMVAALIRALKLDRPLLVGHSMGGALSLLLAQAHPELVRGLALSAPLTQPIDTLPEPFTALKIESPVVRGIVAALLAAPMGSMRSATNAAAAFAPDPAPADFGIRGGGLLSTRPASFRAGSAEVSVAPGTLAAMVENYPSLRVPVAIMFGRQDRLLDATLHGERTAAMIPGATIDLIDGGHMLPVVWAKESAAWIRATAARFPA